MSDFDMSTYLGVFLDEADEQLQILDEEILKLEKDSSNMKTVQNVFRAAHTLKGSSAAMGFEQMKVLTHEVENLFDLIRNRQLAVDTELINLIFECIDYLKVIKKAIVDGRLEETNIETLVTKLDKINTAATTSSEASPQIDNSNTETNVPQQASFPKVCFNTFQQDIILKALQMNYKVMVVFVGLTEDAQLKVARSLLIFNNLKEMGEIIASFPSTETIESDENFNGNLAFVIITEETEQQVISVVNSISEIQAVSISQVTENTIKTINESEPRLPKEDFLIKKHIQEPIQKAETHSKASVYQTVRVDVERLEYLINLVGELVIDQTRIADLRKKFVDNLIDNDNLETFSEVTSHLERVVSDLQEGMMKTRMLPIEQLFNRFPRMVRDLAQKSNKEFDFVIEGEETELDRNLIEEIVDPIIHLLRNSIDHGIESSGERLKLGKSKKGRVVLKADHEENQIVLTIADDGRGIDVNRIKESALKKGTVTKEELDEMTEKDIIFLIFKSGVSTAKEVTDVSGRGVGMDIVRTHIEKLNGIIDIDTTVGEGTMITIKLPLTLAIIPSLLVEFGESKFALPLANVLEINRLSFADVKTIRGQEVGIIREQVLPLVRLHDRLGITSNTDFKNKKRYFVVVVGYSDKKVGLIVDRTLGNQEIVIKPLGKYIGNPQYISGATIMGDGSVALILDVGAVVREEGTTTILNKDENKSSNHDQQLELTTFRLNAEEYGVEINRVKEIITVPKMSKILTAPSFVKGLINLRGALIPVIDMHKRFGLPHQNIDSKQSRIVIVEVKNTLVGMLVDDVKDVLKVNRGSIEDPPDHQAKMKMIQEVCHLPDRLLVLLKVDHLLNEEDVKQMTTALK